MSKSKHTFRVRNALHKVEGEFSEQELLERIKAGKYTGEEEASQHPFSEWHKISAHPKFYDVFIDRLLGRTPKERTLEPKDSPQSPQEKKTRIEPTAVGEEKSEKPVSQELIAFPDVDTQHRAEIDKLLEPSMPHAEEPLSLPLNENSLEETPPLSPTPKSKRPIFIAAGLIILLFVLFKFGDSSDPVPETLKEGKAPLVGESAIQEQKEVLQSLLDEAENFLEMDSTAHFSAAVELADEALSYDTDNLQAIKIKAEGLAHLIGRKAQIPPSNLADVIKRGRELEPHAATYYLAEAIESFQKEDYTLAKEKSQAAAEADPTSTKVKRLQAEMQYLSKDLGAARTMLEEILLKDKSDVRASYLLSKIFFLKGETTKAQEQILFTLKINEMHADSYTLLADTMSAQSRLEEAKTTYLIATKLGRFATKENLVHGHKRLAELYEVKGREEDAAKFRRLAELAQKADTLGDEEKEILAASFYDRSYFLDRGQELLKANKYDNSVKFFQAIQVLHPHDGDTLVKVAEALEKTAYTHENLRRVILLYQRAILQDPANFKPYVNLAVIETEQYNFERAKGLLDKAEKLNPESSDVYLALGKHYFKRQDYLKSRDYFTKAVTINPTNSEPYYYYGLFTLIYKKENIREARNLFHQAYTLDPQNYLALNEWLKLRVINFEKTFAIKFVRALIEKEPTNANLYWILGEIYAVNKEQQRAISYYHKSLDLDNRSSKVRMSLAQALVSVGEIGKAIEEYRLASQLDRRNGTGFFEAATLLYENKAYQRSEENLRQLLTILPNYPGARRSLAKVYQAQEKRDLAIKEMQAEVDNNPENYKFVIEFAEMYMRFEMYEKAIQELTKVTALPNEIKAPQFKLERIRAYLLLSRSLRELKKGEEAEGAIRAALAIDQNDPELHRELGYVYLTLQRDKEATNAFNVYLTRNPAAQDAENIRALIQKLGTED